MNRIIIIMALAAITITSCKNEIQKLQGVYVCDTQSIQKMVLDDNKVSKLPRYRKEEYLQFMAKYMELQIKYSYIEIMIRNDSLFGVISVPRIGQLLIIGELIEYDSKIMLKTPDIFEEIVPTKNGFILPKTNLNVMRTNSSSFSNTGTLFNKLSGKEVGDKKDLSMERFDEGEEQIRILAFDYSNRINERINTITEQILDNK